MYSAVLIRRALPDEPEALTELMMRSKAHWGYDQPFLDACRPLLTITPETIERDPAYCAEIAGTIAGICHIKRLSDDEVNLDDLFVEPAFIGQGVGAALWRYAVALAGEMGARALVFGVDPNARAFYEYMGAVVVGENISKVFPGAQRRKCAMNCRASFPCMIAAIRANALYCAGWDTTKRGFLWRYKNSRKHPSKRR